MAFCDKCQAWFKKKFDLADVNKTGNINLNELTKLAGQPPFENKKPEDMLKIVRRKFYFFYFNFIIIILF